MTTSDKCPFCGSDCVIPGQVRGYKGRSGFVPIEIRKGFNFTIRDMFAFAFGPEASFCGRCNMVWSKADASDAADFIAKFGNDALKAQYAAAQQTQPPAT